MRLYDYYSSNSVTQAPFESLLGMNQSEIDIFGSSAEG